MNPRSLSSDFLVIGSGIAGLTFAIKAASTGTVNIVTKKTEFESNTNYAQGGIASVLSPDDTFESHIEDTLLAGAQLGDRKAVDVLVRSGPDRIKELIEWGTNFSKKKSYSVENTSQLDLTREGGHSMNRIAHSTDLTGREIERALLAKISLMPNIKIFENSTAVDLLTEHQLKKKLRPDEKIHCWGAYILDNESGIVNTFTAKVTLIASGGAGQVYLHTTNPEVATGDGIAMAYRAGARIADMEFIQFHPTSLYLNKSGGPSFLISESVRGEGAVLVNSKGIRFMKGVHPLEDLAPRDIVARAIDNELKRSGEPHVYLDISFKGAEFIRTRFPHIHERCLEEGIDITKEPIPVVPAAHYLCGGIMTDIDGRTCIENLYASGESTRTGVHGANRLASNSLLEGVVFSHRAAAHATARLKGDNESITIPDYPDWDKEGTFDIKEWVLVQHNIEEIKRLMWDYVGIVRTDQRLKSAYKRIMLLAEEVHIHYRKSTVSPRLAELRNLATIAKLIIRSAMTRKHSIGLHYNTDHPDPDKLRRIVILRSGTKPSYERPLN